jgi:preprotein translocase subunit SecE
MAKEAKSNKDVKNKKHFWKDFKAELKKVIWPSPKQLSTKTVAVIVIVLITAAIVFGLDFVFRFLNTGLDNVKENIRNKVVVENTVDSNIVENTIEFNTVENESSVENVQ